MAMILVSHLAPTGGTYYAYPAEASVYSLADWATHAVELVELGAPDAGVYQGELDTDKGFTWLVFSGASQPSAWNAAIAEVALADASIAANAAIAAAQVVKIPRAAADLDPGGQVTRNKVSASSGMLVETLS